ncbi:hypothetical protein JAAARDRAFT_591780 [Jaapia argillacea MUCL 33604]|uniref:Uncharacterized protein n=1 Tax=Jaapia argillacea MUCL 33604 TaxID=933084 RepID=A0A067QBL7_9AGAM|nr:hypothetical protein JAAARDRAFT_591780 [Jaapia argillacea MUCL 33604]
MTAIGGIIPSTLHNRVIQKTRYEGRGNQMKSTMQLCRSSALLRSGMSTQAIHKSFLGLEVGTEGKGECFLEGKEHCLDFVGGKFRPRIEFHSHPSMTPGSPQLAPLPFPEATYIASDFNSRRDTLVRL